MIVKLDCGCEIEGVGCIAATQIQCPLHAAAPAMLAALKSLIMLGCGGDGPLCHAWDTAVAETERLIAQAEGNTK